jgi:hypothetical protein
VHESKWLWAAELNLQAFSATFFYEALWATLKICVAHAFKRRSKYTEYPESAFFVYKNIRLSLSAATL